MIDEETYKRQLQAKQGKRKIRRKGSNEPFELALSKHIGNGRFMFVYLEGAHKGEVIWEENVEIKPKEK